MPTYQYVCTDCDEQLDVHQSFTDPALTECPRCEGSLRKVFNAVGIVFKGSGFYKTDSRKTAAKAQNGSSTKDSASSESGSSSETGSSSSGSDSGSGGSDSSSTTSSNKADSSKAATPA